MSRGSLIEEAQAILHAYHAGEIQAFLSDAARLEQHRPALSRKDKELAASLLEAPDAEAALEEAIRAVGERKVLRLLKRVVGNVNTLHPETWRTMYPYVTHHAADVTWVLDAITLFATGLIVQAWVWSLWPYDIDYDAYRAGPDEEPILSLGWWDWTQMQITDDIGTVYTWAGGRIQPVGPLKMITAEWSGARVGERYTQTWSPGPPPQAHALIFGGTLDLALPWPATDAGLWTCRDVSLGTLSTTISLPDWWSTYAHE